MSIAGPPRLHEVQLGTDSLERFRTVLDEEQWERLQRTAARARKDFEGRVVWNVNSTARGGGVAELMRSIGRRCSASRIAACHFLGRPLRACSR